MSIVCGTAMFSRSFRTLMLPAAMQLLYIKDLKDLSVFWSAFSIDMQVLTDLKRVFHGCALSKSRAGACLSPSDDRGGQAPALRYREVFWEKNGSLHRRARACPSPCLGPS